jgi:hypothetical protein
VSKDDELPDEIRQKLLKTKAEAEEKGVELDEIDLDKVAGGAYSGMNTNDFDVQFSKFGRVRKLKKPGV